MTTVVWSAVTDELSWMPLAYLEPVPAYPEIVKSRKFVKDNPSNFLTCPAVTGYFKNTYVIKSPVDIDLSFDAESGRMSLKGHDQAFHDTYIWNRCDVREDSTAPMMMSFSLHYFFYADRPCMLELLAPSMHQEQCVQNMRVVPGAFDISKWFRPISPVFEIVDPSKSLIIKRGDPLLYVRLIPLSDSKINLEEKEFTNDMRKEFTKCIHLKFAVKNLPLKTLYEIAKKINRKVFRKD